MTPEQALTRLLEFVTPSLEASLDASCVISNQAKIVKSNAAFRALFKLKKRDLDSKPVFCECIKIAACKTDCQIKQLLKTGDSLRFDEVPATIGETRLRILLKAEPLYGLVGKTPIGALIHIRDTTGEILLQAKYHKLLGIHEELEKDRQELRTKYQDLQAKFQALTESRVWK